MTDANYESKLQQAYELIRQERFEEAQAILQPLLFSNPGADVWWLWANAVTEPEDARHALQQVLELEPEHEQARDFLTHLEELYPTLTEQDAEIDFVDLHGDTESLDAIEADIPGVTPPQEPPLYQAADDADVEWADVTDSTQIQSLNLATEAGETGTAMDFGEWLDDLAESEEQVSVPAEASVGVTGKDDTARPARSGLNFRRIVLVLLVLVIAAGGIWLLSNTLVPPTETPAGPTILQPSEALAPVIESLQTSLASAPGLPGSEAQVEVVEYQGEAALTVRVCRGAGPDLVDSAQFAMELAARHGVAGSDELKFIGVSMVNCGRQDALLTLFADIESAAGFADGTLDSKAFRDRWIVADNL